MLRPYESACESVWVRFFGRRQKKAARLSRAVQMSFQPLEARQLLSVSLVSGQLDIVGTAEPDRIVVRLAAGDSSKLKVNDDGQIATFAVSAVSQINVAGGGGGDYIFINQANGPIDIPANLGGGGGDDTVLGSAGPDTLRAGGGINYVQSGSGAASILKGGPASDTLVGSANDNIITGAGEDLISTDSGQTFAVHSEAPLANISVPSSVSSSTVEVKPDSVVSPAATVRPLAGINNNTIVGYTPQEIRGAYGFGSLGAASTTDLGQGQTIGIIDFFDSPTVLADLTKFSQQFGLPLPTPQTFQKVFAGGSAPAVDPDFDEEIALDVDWAHAIAPDAKIVLVEATGSNATGVTDATTASVIQAVETVGSLLANSPAGGGVVSMSFGFPIEQGTVATDASIDYAIDQAFAAFPTVSFFAGSGDSGPGQVSYPAVSPYVTSVGGTFLTLDSNGARSTTVPEEAWNGSGGGVSIVEPEPGYQQDAIGIAGVIPNTNTPGRISPDVAFLSETPMGGVAVFDGSPDTAGNTGWQAVGGTSLATPMFAATVALVNQVRAQSGESLMGASLNDAIYVLNTDFPAGRDFTPITTGEGFTPVVPNAAVPNFNESTGWGTPIPASFIADAASLDLNAGVSPPQTLLVNIPNLDVGATLYAMTGAPATGNSPEVASYIAPGFDTTTGFPLLGGSAVSDGPDTILLTLNAYDNSNPTTNQSVNNPLFAAPVSSANPVGGFQADFNFDLATGQFSGVATATVFAPIESNAEFSEDLFVTGTISGNGQSIGGSFYSVTVSADGTITPLPRSNDLENGAPEPVVQGSFNN